MLRNKVKPEEAAGAPAITPDLLGKLKKQDMKQAIVERFRASSQAPSPRLTSRSKKRSPYWQSADEEC